MTKLCPRGKAAAKRKFKVYPSAYANAYASKICAGKIKDPSGVKRKDFRGPKPMSKGGGADTGTVGEIRSKIGVMFNKAKRQGERIMGPEGRKERLKKIKKMAESAMNRDNIKKRLEFNKSFAQGRRELFKSTAGKNIPAIKKGAMMTAGSQSAMGRIQKAKMIKAKRGKLTFDEKFKMQEKGLTDKKTGKLIPAHEEALKNLKTSELKKMTKTGRNPRLGPGKGAPETKLEAKSFLERRKQLGGRALGKVVGRLGLAGAAAVAGATAVKKMMDKKKVDKKKMGGLKAELNNPAKGYMAGGMADYYKDLM